MLKSFVSSVLLTIPLLFIANTPAHAASHGVQVMVEGRGSVLKNPNLPLYPDGAVVSLSPVPEEGWRFDSWSGDATGKASPLNLLVDGDKQVTAHFAAIPKYQVTVMTQGSGTIEPPGGEFLEGASLSLTAKPASGWVFLEWKGGVPSQQNPLPLTVSSNVALTARFVLPVGISAQPQSAQVAFHGRASFLIVPSGTGPFTFLWTFKGSPISGATSPTLEIQSASYEDEGNYQVRVTGASGSVTSAVAVLTVGTDCSGPGVVQVCDEASLRSAMAQGGLVRFCCSREPIVLSQTIEVEKDVALDGHGRVITIDGNQAVRLFRVHPGVRFAATNISFVNGLHRGAAGVDGLDSGADPVPGAPGEGGAIHNDGGTVAISDCLFSGNRALGGNGPTDSAFVARDSAHPGNGEGGALFNNGGTVTVFNTSFRMNSARNGSVSRIRNGSWIVAGGEGRGGAIYSTGGSVALTRVFFTENRVTSDAAPGSYARGGTIFLESGSVELISSTIQGSSAAADDFGDRIANNVPVPAAGGAIYAAGGELKLTSTLVSGSRAQGNAGFRHAGTAPGYGGAIYSRGSCLIRDSVISANSAVSGGGGSVNTDGFGGGLYNEGSSVIVGSSFFSNHADGGNAGDFGVFLPPWVPGNGWGGAVYNVGTLSITNSTLAINRAVGGARAGDHPSGNAFGGGLFNTNGTVVIHSSTFGSNVVLSLRGALVDPLPGVTQGDSLINAAGTISLRNSLLVPSSTNGNASGVLLDAGYNMSSDASCGFASGTSFNLTNPRLGSLAENGGPTPTMAPRSGSPAIDFGTGVGTPAVDQRGAPRPTGSGFDIGAVEVIPSPELHLEAAHGLVELSFAASAGLQYRLWHADVVNQLTPVEVFPASASDRTISLTSDLDQHSVQFYRLEAISSFTNSRRAGYY